MRNWQGLQHLPVGLAAMRVGQGYDVHRLVADRPLILGGVHVPNATGLLGHSDADCLLHAITDALLGACGLGDIGQHFSDADPKWQGADSAKLLQHAMHLAHEHGFVLLNVDSTIICQQPKLAMHIPLMKNNVAQCLGLSPEHVNVKAKTNELLGYLGRCEAIEAQATVLMVDAKQCLGSEGS